MGYSQIDNKQKNKNNKQTGVVLVMVLLFSSLLAVIVLFIWESAILQIKMVNNHQVEVLARIQAEEIDAVHNFEQINK